MARPPPFDWTPERIERITRGWKVDGLSATVMAKEYGITRNAVLGKLGRLGLLGDRSREQARRAVERVEQVRQERALKKARRVPATPKQRKPKATNNLLAVNMYRKPPREVTMLPVVVDASLAKPWLQRLFGECAYPILGEGADTLSCCHPTEGRTYCPAHKAVMFYDTPAPQKRFVRWASAA